MANLHQAANLLALCLTANEPFMFHGSPGIGKSDVIEATSRALKYDYIITTWASQISAVDTIGVPSVVNGRTVWNPPTWIPTESTHGGLKGIHYLNELPDGEKDVQSALYSWCLKRELAGLKAPEGLRIVADGNLLTDKAAAKRLSTALANRFGHIYATADTKTFNAGVADNFAIRIRPDVLAFIPRQGIPVELVAFLNWCQEQPEIIKNGGMLHNMSLAGDGYAWPSPRTWVKAMKFLDAPEDMLTDIIAAFVSRPAAIAFVGYISVFKTIPRIADIIANPSGCPVPQELGGHYAVACGLARAMTAANIGQALTYLKRLSPSFCTMAVNDAVARDESLIQTSAFVTWKLENQKNEL